MRSPVCTSAPFLILESMQKYTFHPGSPDRSAIPSPSLISHACIAGGSHSFEVDAKTTRGYFDCCNVRAAAHHKHVGARHGRTGQGDHLLLGRQPDAVIVQQTITWSEANPLRGGVGNDLCNHHLSRDLLVSRVEVCHIDHIIVIIIFVYSFCTEAIDQYGFPCRIEKRFFDDSLACIVYRDDFRVAQFASDRRFAIGAKECLFEDVAISVVFRSVYSVTTPPRDKIAVHAVIRILYFVPHIVIEG